MKKYSYDFEIEANTEKEADAKMQALTIIAGKLNNRELEKLAWIIKNDPIKTALEKQALGV